MWKHALFILFLILLVSTGLAAADHEALQWEGFSEKLIEFSGYTWRAKDGGPYGPGNNYFSDSEENIRLDDASNEKILGFEYDDVWLPSTDGSGYSLTIIDDQADWTTWGFMTSWQLSATVGGTPGH